MPPRFNLAKVAKREQPIPDGFATHQVRYHGVVGFCAICGQSRGGAGGVLGRTRNLEFQEAENGCLEVPAQELFLNLRLAAVGTPHDQQVGHAVGARVRQELLHSRPGWT